MIIKGLPVKVSKSLETLKRRAGIQNKKEPTRMEIDHEDLFLNLPSPIITDILSRLPTKTILLCRSVCKTFLKLISEPEFVRLNHSRSPLQLLINNYPSNFPGFGSLNLVEVEDDSNHHALNCVAEHKIPKFHPDTNTVLIGSIHGLVCIYEFKYFEAFHIWNPATRECITIEAPGGEKAYPNVTTYGFGFSPITSQFHLVHIFQEKDKNDANSILKSECQVYTLGKGPWRSIGHAPSVYDCNARGIFLNGNLHWLILDQERSEFISCLDLEKWLFQVFPSPPEFIKRHLATLNTYQGQLCVCDNTSDFDIVLWTMKDYGVKNSWSKQAVISKYPINLIEENYEVVHVIKVFKDGEVLLFWRNHGFLSYHPLERKTLIAFDALDLIRGQAGFPPFVDSTDYVSSVLSLRSFEMESVKVIED